MNTKLRTNIVLVMLALSALFLLGFDTFQSSWRKAHVSKGPSPFESSSIVHKDATSPLIEGVPKRLKIPSVNIDIAVIDGFYNDKLKSWTLTNDKAQYATITPKANNLSGNTFIYGHDTARVFASLFKLSEGAKAEVETDSGHTFVYTYQSAYETDPYDDSLFKYEGPSILTLQTCSGLWYQNRMLFTFNFSEAK